MCEFGPLKDRSSAVLCLCLTQDVHDPTDPDNSSALIVSRIYFVDTPGAERLALDPTSLRIKEGPTLNKSLLGLGSLVKALANPNDSPFAEYGHCVLTSLLQVLFHHIPAVFCGNSPFACPLPFRSPLAARVAPRSSPP